MAEYPLVTRFIHTFVLRRYRAASFLLIAALAWPGFVATSSAQDNTNNPTFVSPDNNNTMAEKTSRAEQLVAALQTQGAILLGENDNAFPARYKQAYLSAQMSLLMLTDNSANLSNNSVFQHLITELPLHNRSVMVILMPPKAAPKPLLRTPADSALESPENNDSENQPDQTDEENRQQAPNNQQSNEISIAQQRIKTAIDFLIEQGSQSVAIFTQQNSMKNAIEATIDNSDLVSGLIFWSTDIAAIDSAQWKAIKQSRVSILDIHHNTLSKSDLAWRAMQFQQADFITDYKSIRLAEGIAGNTLASRRIRHWMETEFRK